jgi:L-methionine (R)-S-oxide reductase
MFEPVTYSGQRQRDEATVLAQLESLVEGEPDPVANMANAAALLAGYLTEVNWVGFYRVVPRGGAMLVLGPFHGLPACVRIPFGSGVC